MVHFADWQLSTWDFTWFLGARWEAFQLKEICVQFLERHFFNGSFLFPRANVKKKNNQLSLRTTEYTQILYYIERKKKKRIFWSGTCWWTLGYSCVVDTDSIKEVGIVKLFYTVLSITFMLWFKTNIVVLLVSMWS